MRPTLVLLALAQSVAIIAAPVQLAEKDLILAGRDGGAHYLDNYAEYGDNGGDGPLKNIQKKEAEPEPEPQTNLSDTFLACYFGYTTEEKIQKRCGKSR
ncbi:hypothetical protein V8E51_017228 [Hyaloscypha variabilis]|uniref:Uncharacterized protein n=1 Tax=Hyaloscypha variabilis (strain UAMH 11265 / GT02V1 / F) TaxID=1149755 RepID=A0A2J6RHU0_HYAVF|nr:hypothetical protein L207DRAFT_584983 [Hyaloscypha variabilis F]